MLVVGAGQAGLGVGFWLSRRTDLSYLLVDAAPRLGQSWLDRWDSLALFTLRRFSALPGRRYPRGASPYPSKDETAAYLTDYAREHELPVRLGARVERLTRDPEAHRGGDSRLATMFLVGGFALFAAISVYVG